jgi:hypothetical protein
MKKFSFREDNFELRSCADRLDLAELAIKAELIHRDDQDESITYVLGTFSVDERGIDFKLTGDDCLQNEELWIPMRRMIKLGIFLCQEMFIDPVL